MEVGVLVPEAASDDLTSPQADAAERHRQVVLVVDDDARLRDLLATVLTPLNCEIVQAASGEEALTLLLQRRVSVIVLDINMPGMDGFETAQLIRDVEELASKPIIFLTGQAEAADLHRGYDLGAVDFLVKPVSRQVFYAKVKALLELDRSFVRLREAAAKLHEQQLQVARAAEIRQRDELAFTRRRERLTNVFAEASIDLATLEQAVVTELSAMFGADCVLRLPTADGQWRYSLSESGGDPPMLQSWLDEHLAGRPCAAPYPAVLVEEMTARSQRVGALCIGRPEAFTETDAALFRGVSVAAALAISNATLYRVAAEYAAVMQATGDAILAVDNSGEIRSCNKAATALFSGEHDALIGRSIVDLAAADDRAQLREQLDVTMATLREHSLEMTLTAFDGRPVDVTVTLSPIGDSVDLHVAAVVHDLTEIKQAQTEIRHLASHDPLTNLANRRRLNERLAHLARQQNAGSALVAMLYLDVNHFKTVNDTYGHDTGDELLVELSARLRDAVGEDTLVCRVGGDEFILVFEGVSSTAAAVATGNRVLAHTQAKPVHCGNVTIQPSLSMGVACLGASAHTPEELLTQADMAMFEAKQTRSSECVLYTERIGSQHQGKVYLRAEVSDAIARSDFRMAYQPIVDSATGALFGLEALVRWRVGDEEIPATEIIALAEDAGQVGPLGRWVVTRSFADFIALGREDLRLHVNLSPDQVLDSSFLDHLIGAQRDNGIAPQRVCLELTEGAFSGDPTPAHAALRRARDFGFSLAIDDFGVDHSSMTNLMHVPVDWLKIDRSFIAEVTANDRVQRLVRSQIAVAATMEVDLIAEGVETQQQADWLREAGCVLQQGYLYSRPIEAIDLAARLEVLG